MLSEAIGKCPEDLLLDKEFRNTFWQLTYHTLFFTHLYLFLRNEDFIPWEKHQEDIQNPDGIPGDPDSKSYLPLIPYPYTKDQLVVHSVKT